MNVQRYWKVVVVVFLFVAMILPLAGAAAQGATVVEFEGIETLVDLVYPGDLSVPGGNFHGRNREWLAYEDADNSCVTGPSHIISNANINKNGSENYWGKFSVEPEGYDGTWEATWHSQDGYTYVAGHGTGVFTGMTIKWIYEQISATELEFTGSINIPPNAQVQCAE